MTTRKAPSLLHPGPWLSGALLLVATGGSFVVAQAIAKTASFAGVESPRMFAVVGLAMMSAPIVLVAVAHHATHKVLDRVAGEKVSESAWPGLTSWWTGMFAWLTATLVTSVLVLAAGVLDSSRMVQSMGQMFVQNSITDFVSWPALVWVVGAGLLYTFERQAKHVFATSAETAAQAPWKFYLGSLARALILTSFLTALAVGAFIMFVGVAVSATRQSLGLATVFAVLTIGSPVIFVAFGDHGVRHVLRLFRLVPNDQGKDELRRWWPGIKSWWTGLYSWFVLAFGGASSVAIHFALFGPQPRVDPVTHQVLPTSTSMTVTFVVVAALLFHVEASLRRRLATRGD